MCIPHCVLTEPKPYPSSLITIEIFENSRVCVLFLSHSTVVRSQNQYKRLRMSSAVVLFFLPITSLLPKGLANSRGSSPESEDPPLLPLRKMNVPFMPFDIPNNRACTLLACLCLLKTHRPWNNGQIALCLYYSFPNMKIEAEGVEQLFMETRCHRHEWLSEMNEEVLFEETSQVTVWWIRMLEGHDAGNRIISRMERNPGENTREIFKLPQYWSRIFPERYPQGFNLMDYLLSTIKGYPYRYSPIAYGPVNSYGHPV